METPKLLEIRAVNALATMAMIHAKFESLALWEDDGEPYLTTIEAAYVDKQFTRLALKVLDLQKPLGTPLAIIGNYLGELTPADLFKAVAFHLFGGIETDYLGILKSGDVGVDGDGNFYFTSKLLPPDHPLQNAEVSGYKTRHALIFGVVSFIGDICPIERNTCAVNAHDHLKALADLRVATPGLNADCGMDTVKAVCINPLFGA